MGSGQAATVTAQAGATIVQPVAVSASLGDLVVGVVASSGYVSVRIPLGFTPAAPTSDKAGALSVPAPSPATTPVGSNDPATGAIAPTGGVVQGEFATSLSGTSPTDGDAAEPRSITVAFN